MSMRCMPPALPASDTGPRGGRCQATAGRHRHPSLRARPASPPARAMRGYTLIEVIVAFAVLGLALMLLLGILSNGTRQVRWSADSGRAALHAQSLLDELGIEVPLEAGRQDGSFEDGRYRWTLDIAPYVDAPMDADPLAGSAFAPLQPVDPFAPQLLDVALAIEWGEGGPRERLQLQTLRLRTADAGAGALP